MNNQVAQPFREVLNSHIKVGTPPRSMDWPERRRMANIRRGRTIIKAITAPEWGFAREPQEAMVNAVADMMHYCDEVRVNFDAILGKAWGAHNREREEAHGG